MSNPNFTKKIKQSWHFVFFLLTTYFLVSCQQQISSIRTDSFQQDSIKKLLRQYPIQNIDSLFSFLPYRNLDSNSLYFLHYELGKLYREKAMFSKAVIQHQKALSIAEEQNDTIRIIQTANQLGTDFRRVGVFSSAAQAHFKALKTAKFYSKKNTDIGKRLLSYSLNGVGNVYKSIGNGIEAYHYFKHSASLDKSTKNHLGLAINFSTIGSVMEYQNKKDSAYYYYTKALHYDSLVNSQTGIAICHNHLGQLFSKDKKWEKALFHYFQARDILEKKKDTWNKLKTENEIAWIYIKQKKYDISQSILKRLDSIATEKKLYGYLAQTQFLFGILYNERRQYKKAGEAWKLCIDYTDSIKRKNNKEKITESRVSFEKEMGNRLIADLNKKNKEEKTKKRIVLISGIVILLLLLTLLLLSYLLFLAERKHNRTLQTSNKIKDKLFSIISHDLKSPVIAQKNAMEVLKTEIDKTDNNILKSYSKELCENASNLVTTINNLMDWASTQTQKIKYRPQNIDITPLIIKELQLYTVAIQQKRIHLKTDLPSSCIVFADRQMIAIVIRNLINNAVKFTYEQGTITVICKCTSHTANFSISDNGMGMTQEQISRLYTSKENMKVHLGTKGEKGTGLGLILCKNLLEYNNSSLLIDSKPEEGTTICFKLQKK